MRPPSMPRIPVCEPAERTRTRLVDTDGQRHVGYAGGNFERRQAKCGRSRSRCIFDLLHRNAGAAQVPQHHARRRHAEQRGAVVHGFHRRPIDLRIAQCFAHRRETQHRIRRFGEALIRVQSDADDVYGAKRGKRFGHDRASACSNSEKRSSSLSDGASGGAGAGNKRPVYARADVHRIVRGLDHRRAHRRSGVESDLANHERRCDRLRLMHVHFRIRGEPSDGNQFDVPQGIGHRTAPFTPEPLPREGNEAAIRTLHPQQLDRVAGSAIQVGMAQIVAHWCTAWSPNRNRVDPNPPWSLESTWWMIN